MPQSSQAIQSRLRSIDSTSKITKVMQLIASTELNKQRRVMEQNREYAVGVQDLLDFAIRSIPANQNPYIKKHENKPAFVIVISSDMGLCGSYNANITRMIKEQLQPNDRIIMVGSRGCAWARSNGIQLEQEIENLNMDTAYGSLPVWYKMHCNCI